MSTPILVVEFLIGAVVSLATSWLLVSRIERIGRRFGASEAMLGLVAALAADSPEVTSAVSALAQHEPAVGAGVVIGSNVFNLAALLGLGAVVAGRIALHRRVVLLEGAVALSVAVVTILAIGGVLPAVVSLVLVVAVLTPYVALAARRRHAAGGRPLWDRAHRWLTSAIVEEEIELAGTTEHQSARSADYYVAIASVVVVVGASVLMERSGSKLGLRFDVPAIVTGGVLLAAVTSMPNAVAAIFLARRGRGPAVLSTALNSNALNVVAGLLLPSAVIGLGRASASEVALGCWYVGLTLLALAFSYRDDGLRRSSGALILLAYVSFVVVLVLGASNISAEGWLFGVQAIIVAALSLALLMRPRRRSSKR